jgi:anti-sigma factor RsiW
MDEPRESVSDLDLHAYVDDQLDLARRVEVEAYLARHPGAAAQVMSDLRTRDALRLVLEAETRSGAPGATQAAAHRLSRHLRTVPLVSRLRRLAAAAALIALGWLAHSEFGPLAIGESEAAAQPPPVAEDAVRAHHTALLRARLRSQPEAPDFDPEEILSETRIAVPALPSGWRILDAQLFPSRQGPSIAMAIEAEEFGLLSLFAARTRPGPAAAPSVTWVGTDRVAFWQRGEMAFALTGDAGPRQLENAAKDLAAR